MEEKNKMLKSVLVGKDDIIVGIRNSKLQDIMYRARIHTKRRASDIDKEEMRRIYDAIMFVLNERIRLVRFYSLQIRFKRSFLTFL